MEKNASTSCEQSQPNLISTSKKNEDPREILKKVMVNILKLELLANSDSDIDRTKNLNLQEIWEADILQLDEMKLEENDEIDQTRKEYMERIHNCAEKLSSITVGNSGGNCGNGENGSANARTILPQVI